MSTTSRHVLRLSGVDCESFLQGLVTNDLAGLSQGLVYTALLTPQGKYMADFFLLRQGNDILLDMAADLAPMLGPRLNMYKLRADVVITDSELKVQRGTGPQPDGALSDPRHSALGWRLYGDSAQDDGTDWEALRVQHCIPETGIELTSETYILEAGFERLNGVDFRKGCFVGQEIVARMKHKTELRKGFETVAVQGSAPIGTEITANGKPVGTLFTQANGQGIAYLRFDRAGDGMTAGEATVTYKR